MSTKTKGASTYTDPEIESMEREVAALRQQQSSWDGTDAIVGMSVIHHPDGSFDVIVAMRHGRVLMAEDPNTYDPTSGWKDLGLPAPNTRSFPLAVKIRDLEQAIEKRRMYGGDPDA